MAKLKNKRTIWYIEPIGSYSNERISEKLQGQTCSKINCSDGIPHDLFDDVKRHDLVACEASVETDPSLKFSVWFKNNQTGQIQLGYRCPRSISGSKNTKAKVNRRLKGAFKKRDIFPGSDMETSCRSQTS